MSEVDELRAEVARLSEELRVAQRDAERYRWLRDKPTLVYGVSLILSVPPGVPVGDITGKEPILVDTIMDLCMNDPAIATAKEWA